MEQSLKGIIKRKLKQGGPETSIPSLYPPNGVITMRLMKFKFWGLPHLSVYFVLRTMQLNVVSNIYQ